MLPYIELEIMHDIMLCGVPNQKARQRRCVRVVLNINILPLLPCSVFFFLAFNPNLGGMGKTLCTM